MRWLLITALFLMTAVFTPYDTRFLLLLLIFSAIGLGLVTAMAGRLSGRMMRQKMVNWLAPSISALSSRSRGMVSK